MGLDMYLYANRNFYSWREDQGDQRICTEIAELISTDLEIASIKVVAGYWRKANQIHRWFVQNVQGDEDTCESFYVSRQNLIDLRDLCQRVKADNSLAPTELPTHSGFFFGMTEYHEWYYSDLENTINIIDKALTLSSAWDFEYRSSW